MKGGVWVKASEIKEIDWPLCIRYDGGGAPYYETVCSLEELWKLTSKYNPLTEIEYLNESAFDELLKQIAELRAEKEQLMADYMNVQTDLQNKIFELEKQLNDFR